MFPLLRQRLLVFAALLLGGLIWLLAVRALTAPGGWEGISLFDTRLMLPLALLWVLVTGLPALLLALFIASTGHPLSGIFVLATALCFPAGRGGAIDGLFYRSQLPGVYLLLIVELFLWSLLFIGFLAAVRKFRAPLRDRLGPLALEGSQNEEKRLALPGPGAVSAGILCAIIGGFLVLLLVPTSDTGQVIGGLIMAFLLASMLAQTLVPQTNPTVILLSPALAGIAGYVIAMMRYASHDEAIAAWHGGEMSGLAMILPIHYLSAGVVGCTLGLGLADSIQRARLHSAEPAVNT